MKIIGKTDFEGRALEIVGFDERQEQSERVNGGEPYPVVSLYTREETIVLKYCCGGRWGKIPPAKICRWPDALKKGPDTFPAWCAADEDQAVIERPRPHTLEEKQKLAAKQAEQPASPMPEKLELTDVLLSAILNKLAVHDAKLTTHPTPSEFFRAYMIDKLTTKAMRLRGWKDRTLRNRRQLAEKVIAKTYGGKVELRKFRDSIDPRVFSAAERELDRARQKGRAALL